MKAYHSVILEFIKREFFSSQKILLNHIPILAIVLLIVIFTGKIFEYANYYLLLMFSLNMFFSLIFFINVYLQKLKDKEIIFLLTLQLDKRSIILSKILYVILTAVIFNIILFLPSAFLEIKTNVLVNAFVINAFLSILIGVSLLFLFLFTSFEVFISYSQYIRLGIMVLFVVSIKLLKKDFFELMNIYNFNILLSLIPIIIVIYISYRIIISNFLKKKTYL
ncbi:MAG: hypothetical protein QME25_02840 [Bacteroidota bacterium]|nr:hypothetical protein [Bacteroidota bacterium]